MTSSCFGKRYILERCSEHGSHPTVRPHFQWLWDSSLVSCSADWEATLNRPDVQNTVVADCCRIIQSIRWLWLHHWSLLYTSISMPNIARSCIGHRNRQAGTMDFFLIEILCYIALSRNLWFFVSGRHFITIYYRNYCTWMCRSPYCILQMMYNYSLKYVWPWLICIILNNEYPP